MLETKDSKVERLEARVTAEQKALFQYAASIQGRTLTDFLVASVQEAATRVIEETSLIRLNAEQSRVFVEAVLNPAPPSERLKQAARRYRKRVISE